MDYASAGLSLLLLAALILSRRQFTARSDPPSVRYVLIVLVISVVFTLLYRFIAFYLLGSHFIPPLGLNESLGQTLSLFSTYTAPAVQPKTHFGRHFIDSIYWDGGIALFWSLTMPLRPIIQRRLPADPDRTKAGSIIDRYGKTALATAARFDDKQYFFSGAETLIAYGVSSRATPALKSCCAVLPTRYPASIISADCISSRKNFIRIGCRGIWPTQETPRY